MTGKPGFWRLFRWMERRAAPCGHEPADVGTAFGMELFLDSAESKRVAAAVPKKPEMPPSRRPTVRPRQR